MYSVGKMVTIFKPGIGNGGSVPADCHFRPCDGLITYVVSTHPLFTRFFFTKIKCERNCVARSEPKACLCMEDLRLLGSNRFVFINSD